MINPTGTVASRTRVAVSGQPNGGSGATETWFYDDLGRVVEATPRVEPNPETTTFGGTTKTTYLDDSITTELKDNVVITELDGFGRVIRTSQAASTGAITTDVEYDALGRRIGESAPYFPSPSPYSKQSTSTYYDTLDRVTVRVHPDASSTTYAYGAWDQGLAVTITESAAPPSTDHRVTTQYWDATGAPGAARLVALQDAGGQWTSYGYDVLDALVAVCGPGADSSAALHV